MANKKLKFEDLVPNNTVGTTVGTAKVTPTVTNMPSYTSLLNGGRINTGAPYGVGNFEVKTPTYTDATNQTEITEDTKTTTTDTVPKMTYEEWYNTAKQNAESTRQSAINDARVEYNRSKSEYGNKAEALRNMGLTGAGYSDYLNGQAYAQMQGAIANANAQFDQSIADIDAKYMDYLEQKRLEEAQKTEAAKNVYSSLYDAVKSGSYNENDISRLASEYNLSEPQIANLKLARNEYAKTILASGDYSMAVLDELYPNGGEDYEKYKTALQDKYKDFDSSWLIEDDGTKMTQAEALTWINEMKKEGIKFPDNIEETVKNAYKLTFTPGIDVKRDVNANSRMGDKGNDVVISDGATKYHVQYKGTTGSWDVVNAAKAMGVKRNDVFMYDNKLYVFGDDAVYEVVSRSFPYAKDYNELVSKIKSSTTTKSEG